MASNSFGSLFKFTTWGESHGKAIGVIIDGCPAGINLEVDEINVALAKRAPGKSAYTSPRGERDEAEILSGVFEGRTTGAPISIFIRNQDADSSKYEPIKHLVRPGHANLTYLQKYGAFDYRGGGRASARETASRVAAGAVAKKFLGINIVAYVKAIGSIEATVEMSPELIRRVEESPIFCPDEEKGKEMMALIQQIKQEGDSIGGVIEFLAWPVPVGLGDPVYEKLEANLAKAMLSIPASKGFEVGSGFASAAMRGSEHNDLFLANGTFATNFAGGILGGISTGMPLVGRVAFKPTSSIKKIQKTITSEGEEAVFELPEGSRHDPCVAIRAAPVVEAMTALVLADAMLLNRCARQ